MGVVASNVQLSSTLLTNASRAHSCSSPPLFCQPSTELKRLLETAFTAQQEALVAHWGKDTEEAGKIDRC